LEDAPLAYSSRPMPSKDSDKANRGLCAFDVRIDQNIPFPALSYLRFSKRGSTTPNMAKIRPVFID
jgi:hypothetical protein